MTFELRVTDKAQDDIDHWKRSDRTTLDKIKRLLADTLEHPFEGIGKPEPLKHDLSGCWSRRITKEHRIVYRVEEGAVILLACRFHYSK